MVDYREILRLQGLEHNITQIAGSLHCSRNTVREVERLADEKGIRWPLGEEATNPQLYVDRICYPLPCLYFLLPIIFLIIHDLGLHGIFTLYYFYTTTTPKNFDISNNIYKICYAKASLFFQINAVVDAFQHFSFTVFLPESISQD